jgi:7-dehydrocholesterol reductase
MNLAGFLLSLLAYLKAYLMPTHPEDRKFSGELALQDSLVLLAPV